MRTIAIASCLTLDQVLFMGSDLQRYKEDIPGAIQCIHLPIDYTDDFTPLHGLGELSLAHYAPLAHPGLRQRHAKLLNTFLLHPDMLLIVDVSVEVALTARLSGIPFIYIRQHGDRTDLPHRLVYDSAELIIAPYSAMMSRPEQEGVFLDKTFFSSGFSRFSSIGLSHHPLKKNLAIFIGRGGSCLDENFIEFLAKQLPDLRFHIIGKACERQHEKGLPQNCTPYGNISNPSEVLMHCEAVIANAGHNTVMELLDLNLPFICIPEDRPFQEQQYKAGHLKKLGLAEVVDPQERFKLNWRLVIDRVLSTGAGRNAKDMIDPLAPKKIAQALRDCHSRLYTSNFA